MSRPTININEEPGRYALTWMKSDAMAADIHDSIDPHQLHIVLGDTATPPVWHPHHAPVLFITDKSCPPSLIANLATQSVLLWSFAEQDHTAWWQQRWQETQWMDCLRTLQNALNNSLGGVTLAPGGGFHFANQWFKCSDLEKLFLAFPHRLPMSARQRRICRTALARQGITSLILHTSAIDKVRLQLINELPQEAA